MATALTLGGQVVDAAVRTGAHCIPPWSTLTLTEVTSKVHSVQNGPSSVYCFSASTEHTERYSGALRRVEGGAVFPLIIMFRIKPALPLKIFALWEDHLFERFAKRGPFSEMVPQAPFQFPPFSQCILPMNYRSMSKLHYFRKCSVCFMTMVTTHAAQTRLYTEMHRKFRCNFRKFLGFIYVKMSVQCTWYSA